MAYREGQPFNPLNVQLPSDDRSHDLGQASLAIALARSHWLDGFYASPSRLGMGA